MEFFTGLIIGALFFIPATYEAKLTHLKEINEIKSSVISQNKGNQLKDVAIKVDNENQKININYQTESEGKPNIYIQEKNNKENDVINFQCK